MRLRLSVKDGITATELTNKNVDIAPNIGETIKCKNFEGHLTLYKIINLYRDTGDFFVDAIMEPAN